MKESRRKIKDEKYQRKKERKKYITEGKMKLEENKRKEKKERND